MWGEGHGHFNGKVQGTGNRVQVEAERQYRYLRSARRRVHEVRIQLKQATILKQVIRVGYQPTYFVILTEVRISLTRTKDEPGLCVQYDL